jgi:hypothetical protein
MLRPTDAAVALAVRAHRAKLDACAQLGEAAARRLARRLHAREDGAQAAEYAMLGGVSAAACGTLIVLLRRPEFLEPVIESVVRGLSRAVRSWF